MRRDVRSVPPRAPTPHRQARLRPERSARRRVRSGTTEVGVTTDYAKAAQRARAAIFGDPQPGRDVLRLLVEEAYDAAETDADREVWAKYRTALSDGHRLAVKTLPATIVTVEGAPPELIAAVNEVFDKEDDE